MLALDIPSAKREAPTISSERLVLKALLKPPHSKRWREGEDTYGNAKRLECGTLTVAFPSVALHAFYVVQAWSRT